MAHSRSTIEAAEKMLCEGMSRPRISQTLGLSRTVLNQIAVGRHRLQSDPQAFLERYSRRAVQCDRTTGRTIPIEVVERVEMLLCWYWRAKESPWTSAAMTKEQIVMETGVSEVTLNRIAKGRHPAQQERDGVENLRPDLQRIRGGGHAHSSATVEAVSRMLRAGFSQVAISDDLNVSRETVRRIKQGTHFREISAVGQAIRTHHCQRREDRAKPFLPSPSRISRVCEQIRQTWTREEEAARYCGRRYWKPDPQRLSTAC